MLIVVRAGREAEVRSVFDRYELHAVTIGRVINEPVVRCRSGGALVCEVSGRALADDAPRYMLPSAPPIDLDRRRAEDLTDLAREAPSASTLLELLAAPNLRSRKPVWRRYDHMNGTSTLVGPGAGDAALLLAISLDGPGRLGALDPRLAAASAAVESAMNVACSGAEPIGATNCLNLGAPESQEGYWNLSETIAGLGEACRRLGVPIVSGNVSLYNETPDGPIIPAPLVGMVGLLADRAKAIPLRWRDGDELWLLGEPAFDAAALAASELAWRRGRRGGTPRLDVVTAAATVRLLVALAGRGLIAGAHDCSVGGLGASLARMAIGAEMGADVRLPGDTVQSPSAALFGERAGRVIVSVRGEAVRRLVAAASDAGVPAMLLGRAAGDMLRVRWGGDGGFEASVATLRAAWETSF
jgi:phosphoribosylformylglycinamidine synthase